MRDLLKPGDVILQARKDNAYFEYHLGSITFYDFAPSQPLLFLVLKTELRNTGIFKFQCVHFLHPDGRIGRMDVSELHTDHVISLRRSHDV